MNIRYIVELSEEERTRLHELTSGGQARVRRVKRAQILLAAEQGHGDAVVAAMVGVGTSTVYRTRRPGRSPHHLPRDQGIPQERR